MNEKAEAYRWECSVGHFGLSFKKVQECPECGAEKVKNDALDYRPVP